ncbi:hypothetical protein JCM11251_004883 [Rhodosporidiobolus azoricus]
MAPSPSPSHSSSRDSAMMTSDELDWLVHSYLQESGYHHTAFSLLNESSLAGPSSSSSSANASPAPSGAAEGPPHQQNGRRASSVGGGSSSGSRNPVMETVVPPGHLVRILQKGLLYLEAEARYRGESPAAPKPRLIGYTIPNALPLPPLPKHVPPPAPPAPPPPALKPAPPAAQIAPPLPPAAKPTSEEKGKGKAPPAATTATGGAKRKGPANVSDREDGASEGPKRARTASAETPKTNGCDSSAGGAGGKKKVKPAVLPAGEKEKENKDVKGKGKAKAEDQEQDEDGDVGMQDGEAAGRKEEKEKRKEREKEKEQREEKEKSGVKVQKDGDGGGKKREREKERKEGELKPPPAKKSSSASSTPAPPAVPASTPANSTSSSSATTQQQPKRSTSPSTSRKSTTKPSSSADPSFSLPSASTSSSLPSTSLSAPPGQGTGKIRITTSTKTISTPFTSASASSASSNTPSSARPSSSSAKDADRLLKVKQEGDPSASGSPSKTNGSSRPVPPPPPPPPGGKKPSSRPSSSSGDPSTSKKPSLTSSTSASSAASKDKDPLKAKDKEREREREKKRARERERDDGVDLRFVKRVGSEDVKGVVKLRGHTVAKVQPCAFNTHVPSLLATGGGDSTCRIWDVPPPSASSSSPSQTIVSDHIVCKHASAQRKVDITCVAWDPSGSLLATGSEDGIARIWTPSGDLHLVLSMHMRSICSLKWSPSGTQLLTSSLDQTVCLWELSSGKVKQQYGTHADSILDVDWLDEGTWASASMDKTVHLLSTNRPTPLHRFRGHRDEVNTIQFSPCGTLLASCSDDSTVRIHSLRSIPSIAAAVAARPVKKGDKDRLIDQDEEDGGGGGVWVLEGHKGEVHQVAWHPRAGKDTEEGPRLIASCSFDHTARLWNADTGSLLYTFSRSTDFVYSVAFEPQLGRWLATGSNDGRLEVWKVQDRSLHLEYTHSAPIYELTWHPHGTQIAICGESEDVAVVAFEGTKGK